METFLRQLCSLSSIGYVLFSESLFYLIWQDYEFYVQRIAYQLANVNILYVKLFQAIASNQDWIDDETNRELLRFTDKAPWTYQDFHYEELIEVTEEYDLILPQGYETPINAGMISLVFKAFKRSDRLPVIIKMKRKSIDLRLSHAIEDLQLFLYFLSFFPMFNQYQIKDIIDKNIDMIIKQLNFNEEVNNIVKVRNHCKHLKYVKIPDVLPDVTEKYPNFIIMEYIDGMRMSEVDTKDYHAFAKQVLKFGLVTTIVHGTAHGDLHSGNIFFIKDPTDEKYPHKIGVIDFGIVFELDPIYKNALFDFLTQLFQRPARESVIQLLEGVILNNPEKVKEISSQEYENIVDAGVEVLEEILHNTQKVHPFQLYNFLCKMHENINQPEICKLGIHPSESFIKTQMVLAMAHGVTISLCKDKFVSIMEQALNELFHVDLFIEKDPDIYPDI
jgi:predicted unusual protein kinase regulating ubiquinone biosynthesis (AarF/ABC1/UbiB family)